MRNKGPRSPKYPRGLGRQPGASSAEIVDARDPAVAQTLLLAAIFIGIGLVWLTSYALLVAKVGELLNRSVVRRLLNAVTPKVLTALGVRLAFTDR